MPENGLDSPAQVNTLNNQAKPPRKALSIN